MQLHFRHNARIPRSLGYSVGTRYIGCVEDCAATSRRVPFQAPNAEHIYLERGLWSSLHKLGITKVLERAGTATRARVSWPCERKIGGRYEGQEESQARAPCYFFGNNERSRPRLGNRISKLPRTVPRETMIPRFVPFCSLLDEQTDRIVYSILYGKASTYTKRKEIPFGREIQVIKR